MAVVCTLSGIEVAIKKTITHPIEFVILTLIEDQTIIDLLHQPFRIRTHASLPRL